MREDLPYWLALLRFRKFGPIRFQRLMRRFKTMREAFFATAEELAQAEIEHGIVQMFLSERAALSPEKEMKKMEAQRVSAITIMDDAYPPLLKTIYDPPPVLFVRGALPSAARPHLAIVGSREPTPYGRRAARLFARAMAESGSVIVSGLAYGIDAEAHNATIEANGTTVAVLAGGIEDDSIYPSQHRHLASSIIATNGAIISEFPIGTASLRQHFPFRNRVIAGLCQGTLVIEAAEKSGSLITARSALESGRDVYAVPGPIDSPLSEGPNNLIKMGATPATKPEDLGGKSIKKTRPLPAFGSREEETLFARLSGEPKHVDDLVNESALAAPIVTRTLTLMEMKGLAKHVGGLFYVRNA